MSIPSIIVGRSNWAVKPGKLLGYANSQDRIVPREFAVTRALDTATRINSNGYIELVPANVPRVDFLGGQRRLLVEPLGINLFQNSGLVGGGNPPTNWSQPFSTGTSTAVASTLNSSVSAYLLVTSGTRYVFSQNISQTSGTVYTLSVYVEEVASGSLTVENLIGYNFSVAGIATYLEDNTVILGSHLVQSGKRYSLRITAPSTASVQTRVGNGIGGASTASIRISMPQIEAGSVATSFIPSPTGATATRNADVVSLTGVAGLIGQTEGTIYFETNKLMDATLERFFSIYSSTSPTNDNITISKTTGNTINFGIRKNNVLSNYVANFSGTVLKLACAFNTASGGVAIYVNGTQLLIDTNSGSFASVLDEVYIGRLRPSVNTDNLYNGRIRAIDLYPNRLSNAQLATLTAL